VHTLIAPVAELPSSLTLPFTVATALLPLTRHTTVISRIEKRLTSAARPPRSTTLSVGRPCSPAHLDAGRTGVAGHRGKQGNGDDQSRGKQNRQVADARVQAIHGGGQTAERRGTLQRH
jgi:hypothetical protein